MPEVSFEEIKKYIEDYTSGIYFIYGDEDYFINCIYTLIKNKYKNIDIFYGNENDIEYILTTEAYQQQIFSDERIIIIKNLELNKFICDKKNENRIKSIIDSFRSNIIVLLVYNKNIPKTSNLLNIFSKCQIYNSKKLPSYKIKTFIKHFSLENNININDTEIDMIYNYYGDNISLIINELKNHRIDNIVFSKEFNSFELLTYITQRNFNKIILTVNNFHNKNKYDLIPFLGLLFSNMMKQIYEIKHNNKNNQSKNNKNEIEDIIETIQYCDNWIKGINSSLSNHKYVIKYLIGQLINKY